MKSTRRFSVQARALSACAPRLWLALATLAALGAGAAHAADAPLSHNDPSRISPGPPAPAPSAPLALSAGAPALAPQDVAPRFLLRDVRFEGASALPQARLRPAWAGLAGKSVSLADLRAIGRQAEAIYAESGYPFVAVLLKVQEVEDGVVHFDVVEGRITDLTIIGSDPVARRQASAMLQPLVNRAPLSLGEVEGDYELGRKVPGLSISGALRRGEKAGGMDLVVAARRETWRAYANVNNLYANAVGPWGVLVGGDYYGASQYGDTTSLEAYTSIPFGRQELVRASHSQGLDSQGLTAAISGLWGHADPKGDLANLQLATDIEALRLEASQPLWVRHNGTVVATVAFDASDQRTLTAHTTTLSDDRLRTLSGSLAGELTGRMGRIAANIEVRKGEDFAGARHEGDTGDPEAFVFRGGLEAQSAPFAHVQLALRIDAQQSDDTLTPPDKYSVGNLSIGRGYQPGLALGDSALGGAFEARVGPFPIGARLTAQPFAFVDDVRLWNNGVATVNARTLTSLGGGVRLQVAGKFNLELTYAAPQQAPLGLGDKRPGPTVLFNMTVGLNDAFAAIHRKLAAEAKK